MKVAGGDHHTLQHPKAERSKQGDQREGELHPADAPDPTQGGKVDHADGS